MDPESRKLLEKTLSLTEENNKMLRKVRGVQKRHFFWAIFKLFIIIGIAFGLFYFLEPYVNKITNVFSQISGTKQNLNSSFLQDVLKKY